MARRKKEKTYRFCPMCGLSFAAARIDAVFCSSKCRQRAVRAIARRRPIGLDDRDLSIGKSPPADPP